MASLMEAIEIKRKMFFEFEGAPYHCIDVEVSKPTARGGQTLVRLKMRNLLTRAVFDKTFKAGDKFPEPDLVMDKANFSYSDSSGYHFLDQETFETVTLSGTTLGEDRLLLADNVEVQIQKFNGNPIGIHRTGRARRHGQRRRDESRPPRDRPRDPRAALHQRRRKGEGPHRDAGVRRPGLVFGFCLLASGFLCPPPPCSSARR